MMQKEIPERWRTDPLYRALEAGNLRAAKRMLDKRESLSWHETAVYVPLAFRRPAWLLRQILDLGPEGQVYCAGEFVRPGGGWRIRVCSTLLVVAAALDDLVSVEELLRRDYYQDWGLIRNEFHPNLVREWTEDMSAWSYEIFERGFHLDMFHMFRMESKDDGSGEKKDYNVRQIMQKYDPLGAAIGCGALRCVARLLPKRAEELSLEARNILSGTPLPGDEERQRAVMALVEDKYGMELAELLDPGEFRDRDNPLFLRCLEKHPEWFNLRIARQFIEWADDEQWKSKDDNWAWQALPLIPPHLVAAVVLEKLPICDGSLKSYHLFRGLLSHPQVHIRIDRCAVRPNLGAQRVLDIVECMEVTGEAPEGGLSGLAVAMLNAMLHCLEVHDDVESQCRQRMLKSPEARAILEGEDPEMAIAYLDWKAKEGGALYKDTLLLMTILGLREERRYEL